MSSCEKTELPSGFQTCFHPLDFEVLAQSSADVRVVPHELLMPVWQIVRCDLWVPRNDVHAVIQDIVRVLEEG